MDTLPLKNELSLYQAFLSLKTEEEWERFLKDLCTPQEIRSLKERWRVCQLLQSEKHSYRDIHQITGASLTTIGRVARFLKEEPYYGYKIVLERLEKGS